MGEDSYGYWAGDANFYRYVYGSPSNFVDPSGHLAFLIPWALIEAAGWAGLGGATAWAVWDTWNKNPGTFASPSISLPWNGVPDSTDRCRREDGTPKQKRRYGPDGTPLQDVDYDHDHGYGSPHVHDWNGKKRSKGRKPVDSDGDVGFDAD